MALEKPTHGIIIRPPMIVQFDPVKKRDVDAYEDLMVMVHGKSPQGDWIYRVRKEPDGVWRGVRPSDRDGGLIVFVREDPPPAMRYISQDKKLGIRIVQVLSNAVIGVLQIID